MFNDQDKFGISNLGHCYLFDICDLGFGIYKHQKSLNRRVGTPVWYA